MKKQSDKEVRKEIHASKMQMFSRKLSMKQDRRYERKFKQQASMMV